MNVSIFTYKERTVKDKTVAMAVVAAMATVREKTKNPSESLCMDMLKGRSESEVITTEQMSDLVNLLVDDTLYWLGWFDGSRKR